LLLPAALVALTVGCSGDTKSTGPGTTGFKESNVPVEKDKKGNATKGGASNTPKAD
jgi:hypothetical protein